MKAIFWIFGGCFNTLGTSPTASQRSVLDMMDPVANPNQHEDPMADRGLAPIAPTHLYLLPAHTTLFLTPVTSRACITRHTHVRNQRLFYVSNSIAFL